MCFLSYLYRNYSIWIVPLKPNLQQHSSAMHCAILHAAFIVALSDQLVQTWPQDRPQALGERPVRQSYSKSGRWGDFGIQDKNYCHCWHACIQYKLNKFYSPRYERLHRTRMPIESKTSAIPVWKDILSKPGDHWLDNFLGRLFIHLTWLLCSTSEYKIQVFVSEVLLPSPSLFSFSKGLTSSTMEKTIFSLL